ncbi:MAG: hypothetical protein WCJ37_04665 [Syntrophus sp. (in: bacteria)]
MTTKPISSVKRFYFLEYFYVLLKSIEKYAQKELVFDSFKILKHKHRLGESKYKTLASDVENPSRAQLNRYRYTFGQVIDEAIEYDLVNYSNDRSELRLTEKGAVLLKQYDDVDNGPMKYNRTLFKYMEAKYGAFRYHIEFLYQGNKYKPGLLVLPIYSPRQLHFERSAIKTRHDIVEYSKALVKKLEDDIEKYLGERKTLAGENKQLLAKLTEADLIPSIPTREFSAEKYNVITKRFRDFWVNYFLRDIYGYEYSLNSFDIWTYRGKQIGIIQATEFYPNFNGRLVYPTSVVLKSTQSNDFKKLYDYPTNFSLFVHEPIIPENQEKFVDSLLKAYLDLRRFNRSYFISLSALREIVCYNMKLSENLFEAFLNNTYKLNLAGLLKIRISLEVDKLPEETQAMYLKQEPVMVDGKYRNIIAIDVAKGGKFNEKIT